LKSRQIPLHPPEAVKKFRQREFGGPGDARGRDKFTPPKQALVSPWPAWDLTHWSRSENQLVFIKILPSCRGHSAEVGKVLRGHLSPAGFWRRQFVPPPGNERGLSFPPLDFFTASLFQRGKKWKEFSLETPKALLPLKKGGREGFLARPFQSAKVLPLLEFDQKASENQVSSKR
jgi:hypothetical protein